MAQRFTSGICLIFALALGLFAFSPPGEAQSAKGPLILDLKTSRDTYNPRYDIGVKAQLWAVEPTTLCVYPHHPEANFNVDIYRAGFGKIPFTPNVVQLTPKDMQEVKHVKLKAGEMYQTSFNLKRMVVGPPSYWKPGEYRIKAKFFLCAESEQGEQEISSNGPLRLLILD